MNISLQIPEYEYEWKPEYEYLRNEYMNMKWILEYEFMNTKTWNMNP